jgi:uncharacterized membrane protein
MKPGKPLGGRLAFLDWTRGLAALIMLQGHSFHSFTAKELRESGPYVLSQFVGGIVPAIFLFLTGVTLAFLMDSGERKGFAPAQRMTAALRRAGYLLALAFVIRLQMWLFGLPYSAWTDLLKVDVLNCMGFGLALMSVMAVFTTRDRIRLCAVLGVAIAAASPLAAMADWSGMPELLKNYLAPNAQFFAFFPWAAFLAFGLSAGSIIRVLDREQLHTALQWSAVGGVVLIVVSQYAANMPYSVYEKSDFWLNSPWLILIKLGVIFIILPFAYLWTTFGNRGFSWIQQLGATSLLVYWVHIELVYGRWFGSHKESLNIPQCVAVSISVILSMVALSVVKTRWRGWAASLTPGWGSFNETRRASGD